MTLAVESTTFCSCRHLYFYSTILDRSTPQLPSLEHLHLHHLDSLYSLTHSHSLIARLVSFRSRPLRPLASRLSFEPPSPTHSLLKALHCPRFYLSFDSGRQPLAYRFAHAPIPRFNLLELGARLHLGEFSRFPLQTHGSLLVPPTRESQGHTKPVSC